MQYRFNILLALNCLLLSFLFLSNQVQVPQWLHVAGRLHPAILHFPIALLFVSAAWELGIKDQANPLRIPTGNALLWWSGLTAAVTALAGFFLSKEGGYEEQALLYHQWTGAAVSLMAFGWYAFRDTLRLSRVKTAIPAAFVLLGAVVAGHLGGNLTHGEGYLFAPLQKEEKATSVSFEQAEIYTHLVKPIFDAKCMSCHNSSKAKGELVMETPETLLKGGKNGKLWDLNAPELGLLLQRLHLNPDEKEHMPPKGKPQLTDAEIKILALWIKNGADFKKKISDLPENDSLRLLAAPFFKTTEPDFTFAAADPSAVQKLNTEYRVIYPISLGSPALAVDFFGRSFFKSEQIKELQTLKNQIVSLNLNRMPVKDEDLSEMAAFTQLRTLNLASTAITGATLGALKPLTELRKLSLSGTNITAAHLQALQGMPHLTDLYVWNTGILESDLPVLHQQFPGVRIENGFKGDTVVAQLNAPVIAVEKSVFKEFVNVKVKNYIKGAVIRYTLDGSVPDSLHSPICPDDSLKIDRTAVLTTKAFLPGWISSPVAVQSFYKIGFLPDSVRFVQGPDAQYKGSGTSTLFDRATGETNFRTPEWLGFRFNPMEALLYFRTPTTLSSVSLSSLVEIGSYIMPAATVEVWGGPSEKQLSLLKRLNPVQPTQSEVGYRNGITCAFAPQKVSVIKLIVRPVGKLPNWHPGKGDKGWVFLDEVFLN